jgi:glycine betaine monooxygenase B
MTTTVLPPTLVDVAPPLDRRDDLDDSLVCVAVHDVTHDVRSFVLRPAEPAAYRFQPGQHLTLTVPVDGRPLSRCYTIASSPWRPDELTITVKRVPGGPVSSWLHDHLRPGDHVAVDGPLGRFSTAHHPAERYLFLSAGSGITPLMSMLRAIHDTREPVDVVFVHHARTPADIIFRDELRVIESEHPGVRVVVVCEGDTAHERWTGPRGRIDLATLTTAAPDLVDREVFTCGPAPYMAAVRDLLARAGADPERCHEESFDLATAVDTPAPVAAVAAATGPTYTVELRRSARTLECDEDTTLLAAAAQAGLSLPSSCQEGMCGTCKTTLLSGSVEMNHAGGIRPREVAQDKILLCCSTPREDLVLDA